MKEKQYLFCPGPVMVSEKVRQALLHPDMCHRVPSFENIIQNVQNKLLEVYKANEDYAILLITGSGTAANETVISSYFTDDDEVLLISNGEFGDRLEELLQIHKVKADILKYEWGKRPDVSDVERKLKANRHITTMMMVFHETSTGVVNPVKEVGELAARYGKTYIVDGVSAVAGEDVDVVRDHIDFCTSSSNKCLASFPGVGIICANKSKTERTQKNKTRVAYLNLYRLYQMSENLHQTPNTPSVTMFIALEAAVQRLLEEGLAEQINRHQRCARMIRDGVRKMGLRLLIEDKVASNTVSSVFLPAEISMADFIGAMEEKGFTVYAGKGPLKPQNMFQIANMGEIDEEMCHVFLKTMEETLADFTPMLHKQHGK
jgi:2-aminoethylphosphonate-pyruvate transaminase